MKQSLPLMFLAVLATATPAAAQYVFVDANGDGACTSGDVLPYGDGTIDVWIDTSHDMDGSTATCSTGEDLTIASYDVVLASSTSANASVTFHGWTNAVSQFTQEIGVAIEGPYLWAGYQSPGAGTHLAAGKYKLGTLSFTGSGSGCAYVYPIPSATISGTPRETGFWSDCLGANQDNIIRLGPDFTDVCGTGGVCDDAQKTTWGKIKDKYRH